MRKDVTQLVRAAKRYYMTELPANTLWQNLRTVGAAENPLDTGPVIFSPDKMNCSDIVTDQPVYTLPARTPQSVDGFNFRTVSISTTKRAIWGIRSNAIGLDGISLKFIKLFLPLMISPVTHIFNTSISSKTFPGAWKTSKIDPVA
jgi:hypothetical protein